MVNEYAAHNHGHGEETAAWSWSHAKGKGKMHDMVEAQHSDWDEEIETLLKSIPDFTPRKPIPPKIVPNVPSYVHANVRDRCPHAVQKTVAGRLHGQIDRLITVYRPNPLDFLEQVVVLARVQNPVNEIIGDGEFEFEFADGSTIYVSRDILWSFS